MRLNMSRTRTEASVSLNVPAGRVPGSFGGLSVKAVMRMDFGFRVLPLRKWLGVPQRCAGRAARASRRPTQLCLCGEAAPRGLVLYGPFYHLRGWDAIAPREFL